MSYNYEYFEEIKRGGFEFILPLNVIDILKQLNAKFNINTELVKQIKFDPMPLSGKALDIHNTKHMFNNSVYNPPSGQKLEQDNYIQTVRLLLNKVSDKTYMDCVTKIIHIIEKLKPEEIPGLYINMFEVILHNSFYSKLYADVYSLCITTNPLFLDGFTQQYDKYIQSFNDIKYVDPNTDYDNYCINNSTNEIRKTFGKFMLNLNKNNIIDITTIHFILDLLLL